MNSAFSMKRNAEVSLRFLEDNNNNNNNNASCIVLNISLFWMYFSSFEEIESEAVIHKGT